MDCDAELQRSIDKELTYTITSHNPTDPPQVIVIMSISRQGLISIPIGRNDLIPKNYEIDWVSGGVGDIATSPI